MYQSSTLLRAASVVCALYCLGHMSGIPWTPSPGPAEQAVVTHMQAVSFVTEGARRTYWDFYHGFGLIVGGFLALQAATLWFLAPFLRERQSRMTPLLVTTAVGFALNAVFAGAYFFALPCIFAVLIAALVLTALWSSRRREARAALDAAMASPQS